MATTLSKMITNEGIQSLTYYSGEIQGFDYNLNGALGNSQNAHKPKRRTSKTESIHSGHFMVSEIDDADNTESASHATHESDYEQPDSVQEDQTRDYDLKSAYQATAHFYSYGQNFSQKVMIDASLGKLFECMSLAYSGKISSPKWKTFKGLKLRLKDKIRLNNIIWRAWQIQHMMSKKSSVSQFAFTVDCESHNKPEAVVLEGKYWKRKLASVTAEYQKWRAYYHNKDRMRRSCTSKNNKYLSVTGDLRFFDWLPNPNPITDLKQVDEDFLMDFSDTTLFNSLLPPNTLDYSREMARSEFIQPALSQFQPVIDDIMDTFEFNEFLTSKSVSMLPPLPEETSNEMNADLSLNTVQTSSGHIRSPVPSATHSSSSSLTQLTPNNQMYLRLNDHYHSKNYRDSLYPSNNDHQSYLDYSSIQDIQDCNPYTISKPYSAEPPLSIPPKPGVEQREYKRINSVTDNNFAVPKVVPKQRSRSRSFSTPQTALSNFFGNSGPQYNQMPTQCSSISLTSRVQQEVQPLERSTSLPVYHSRKISLDPMKNTQEQQKLFHSYNSDPNINPDLSRSFIMLQPNFEKTLVQQKIPSTESSSLIAHLLSNNPHQKARPNSKTKDNTKKDDIIMANMSPSQAHLFTIENVGACGSVNKNETSERKISSPNLSPLSHTSINSPTSSQSTPLTSPVSSLASPVHGKTIKVKSDCDRLQYKEHRRVCHINAEQKRRCNIKNGFDTLRTILPSVSQNTSTKVSKAAMLQKAANYIRTLKMERQQQQEEYEMLQKQVESLNQTIGMYQSQLPETGVPMSSQRVGQIKDKFDEYVRKKTAENWKFWIFSIIMEPFLSSYDSTISMNSFDEMSRSIFQWLDQSCSLMTLRRDVLNSLRFLSTSTNVLTNPATLPEEAKAALSKNNK